MFVRRCLSATLLFGVGLLLSSCSSPSLVAIHVSPTTSYFGGIGATEQLTATGVFQQGNHPAITRDITDQVTWKTSSTDVVVISATGMVTSTNTAGSAVIYASMNGFTGLVTGTAQAIDCSALGSGGTGCKTTTTP